MNVLKGIDYTKLGFMIYNSKLGRKVRRSLWLWKKFSLYLDYEMDEDCENCDYCGATESDGEGGFHAFCDFFDEEMIVDAEWYDCDSDGRVPRGGGFWSPTRAKPCAYCLSALDIYSKADIFKYILSKVWGVKTKGVSNG